MKWKARKETEGEDKVEEMEEKVKWKGLEGNIKRKIANVMEQEDKQE